MLILTWSSQDNEEGGQGQAGTSSVPEWQIQQQRRKPFIMEMSD